VGGEVMKTPKPWSEDAIYELLRKGRKSFGPWDDCIEADEFMPDENDASLIAAAPDLLDALQALYDAQNGAPLERDKTEWEEAMRMAEEALKEVK